MRQRWCEVGSEGFKTDIDARFHEEVVEWVIISSSSHNKQVVGKHHPASVSQLSF